MGSYFQNLAIGQEGQIVVFIVTLVLLFSETGKLSTYFDEWRADILEEPQSRMRSIVLEIIPKSFMVNYSFYIGGIISAMAGIILIMLYIPSTVGTVLKLRCGLLPSLHDPCFEKYRQSGDTIYFTISNMVYGLLGYVSEQKPFGDCIFILFSFSHDENTPLFPLSGHNFSFSSSLEGSFSYFFGQLQKIL